MSAGAPEWPFQTALYALLSTDGGLGAMGVDVVSEPAPNKKGNPQDGLPIVAIGDMETAEAGTARGEGAEIFATLHTYAKDRTEVLAIQARLFAILDRAHAAISALPELAGEGLTLLRREGSRCRQDPDRVFHGVCDYRALFHESEG